MKDYFFHLALVVIQAIELPCRSTTTPVTQKNMVSWGIRSMLTASSCTHLHHLSLMSALTKPLSIGFKDTKRTFWLIHSWGEKAALLFSEPTVNTDQQTQTWKCPHSQPLTWQMRWEIESVERVVCDMVQKKMQTFVKDQSQHSCVALHLQHGTSFKWSSRPHRHG